MCRFSPGRPKKDAISAAYARLIDKRLPDDIRQKLGPWPDEPVVMGGNGS